MTARTTESTTADPFEAIRKAVDKGRPRAALGDIISDLTVGWRFKADQLSERHNEALRLVDFYSRADRFDTVVWQAREAAASIDNWNWNMETNEQLLDALGDLLRAVKEMPGAFEAEEAGDTSDDRLVIPPLHELLNPDGWDSDFEKSNERFAVADAAKREAAESQAAVLAEMVDQYRRVIDAAEIAGIDIDLWAEAEERDAKDDARDEMMDALDRLIEAVDNTADALAYAEATNSDE